MAYYSYEKSINEPWIKYEKQLRLIREGNLKPNKEEAIRFAKRIYRKGMGKPWKGKVKITSGNRYTWIRRGILVVNPDHGYYGGWRDILHEISHYIHWHKNPGKQPHDASQFRLERDLTEYAIKSGICEGKLKSK